MFLPLHDHNQLEHVPRPYVNLALIAANVLVYVFVLGAGFSGAANAAVYSYGLIPSVFFDVRELAPHLEVLPDWAGVVTYAFLHGDFMHLLGNMLFLWVFGDNVEDAMGHLRYLVFYLLCAAAGGYAYAILDPSSDIPLIGASGAVSGIVAAYLMLHPKVRIWVIAFGRIPLRLSAMWLLGAWVIYQFVQLLTSSGGQVAWIAHIGGMVAGAVLILFFRRRGVVLFDRDLR